MFRSNGVLLKSVTYESFTPASWNGWPNMGGSSSSLLYGVSYGELYKRQLWVAVLVNKIAAAAARLPLKVYERGSDGRDEARDVPFAMLLRQPNPHLDPFLFWLWTVSTLNVHGEAFWLKIRDRGGRPIALVPWHPTGVVDEVVGGKRRWSVTVDGERTEVQRRDLVHFREYHPDTTHRGLSRLEPLRDTLENEAGARKANSALWRNGGRPGFVLKHPGTMKSQGTVDRLRNQWNDLHGGVDNWGKTAILEEGMEPQALNLNAEELQYIESRKLNREEVCAAYDVPPPVVHILDRATFSNITEQMRSMYRDTMAPKLKLLESTLEFELRDGRFGESREPDFSEDVYAEFLMDEVLRGSFEARTEAYQRSIQSGWQTPAEVRRLENLPFVEGSDQLFINSAVVPIDQTDNVTPGAAPNPDARNIDPVVRRHLLGIKARLDELDGGTDG